MQEPPPNRIALSTDSSCTIGRIVSEPQPGNVLAESSSAHQAHLAAFVKATPSRSVQRNRRSQPEQLSQVASSSNAIEYSTSTASSRSLEPAEPGKQDHTKNDVSDMLNLDTNRFTAGPRATVRKPTRHLLRRHPQIKQALQAHRFRWAISEILRHPELRKKEALLSQVRKAMWEHANGGQSCKGVFVRLKVEPGKRRTLKDFGLTDLSARLGMPPAGYQRGPHWEQVHRTEVWEKGRLPSETEILKAIELDINLGLMPRVGLFPRAAHRTSHDASTVVFDSERERQKVNQKLSAFVRSGAISSGTSESHASEGSARSSGSRSRPGKVQVSRLFAMIDRYRQRGFRPNRVTANIAVKCWLRSLQARQTDGSRMKDSDDFNRQDAERILSHVIDEEAFNSYKDRPGVADDIENWNHVSLTSQTRATDRSPLLYDKHVKPLGRLLIKSSRARGDWQAARRILRWLAFFKARCRAKDLD